MKKISLKVVGLSYSQSQIGSYICILAQKKGNKKIPVIIKPNDAQYIAIKLESLKTSAPMTHDLVRDITDTLSASINEIIIHDLVEGQFYCQISLEMNGIVKTVSCGIGDAISLSLSHECPLYAYKSVMVAAGITIDESGKVIEDEKEDTPEETEKVSLESLEQMLKEAIESEEYELASQLRDKIADFKAQKS